MRDVARVRLGSFVQVLSEAVELSHVLRHLQHPVNPQESLDQGSFDVACPEVGVEFQLFTEVPSCELRHL
jgi:hypothetical protein